MHSRRPPSLRHKGGGNRRHLELKRKKQDSAEDPGKASGQSTSSSSSSSVSPSNGTTSMHARRKKKILLFSSRHVIMVCVLFAFGLYIKFVVISTASAVKKGNPQMKDVTSLRGAVNSQPAGVSIESNKQAATTSEEEKIPKQASNVNGEPEDEMKQWKDLVEEQTTKKEESKEEKSNIDAK